MKGLLFTLVIVLATSMTCRNKGPEAVITGAGRLSVYIPELRGMSVGIVANHTSLVGSAHLVDTLKSAGTDIKKIFSPEHGFRGRADAGELVSDSVDVSTGIPVISLYGAHRKPTADDFSGIDIILFDLQDVGTRFYTYISTLQYVMERAAEMGIRVIVLDRPNPNGHFVDGPILDTAFRSFVGMQAVPIVHGMTTGEYAMMINDEGWLQGGIHCDLEVIPCLNYTHSTYYYLPVGPSPNLPNQVAVWLYPSLCLFEGTVVSVGRGTSMPFQVFGNPLLTMYPDTFTPVPGPGSANPVLNGQLCYGLNLSNAISDGIIPTHEINLQWLIDAYNNYPDKDNFFTGYFTTLTGGETLRNQIIEGLSAGQIRETWKEGLAHFREIRSRYLLYPE
jgi:uncharacterized protein YbbC (DUF1343 family)